jgi:hypothetical protein
MKILQSVDRHENSIAINADRIITFMPTTLRYTRHVTTIDKSGKSARTEPYTVDGTAVHVAGTDDVYQLKESYASVLAKMEAL